MSKISSMMNIAQRSMQNSQMGLQTVSHNIANKSTEGYSRQRVNFVNSDATGFGKTRVGMGARAGRVERVNNPYLEKQIEKTETHVGYSKTKAESMARVEEVYNEQINKGLNHFMGDFFNSFRELSNNPESLAARTLVKESADFLTKDFQRVDKQLSEIQKDIDFQLAANIEEINQITKEIADLNEKVQRVSIEGGPASDERDRRDLLVKQLSERLNINYAESDTGLLSITAGDSAVIVSGYSSRELFVSPSEGRKGKREGNFDIFYRATKEGTPVNITNQIKGGELGGLLEVRDKTINGLLSKVDHMAYTLSNEVNKAHVAGFNNYSETGRLFFEDVGEVKGAANRLSLSAGVKNDVGNIAAAADANSPGDNRIANVISQLQYKKTMEGGRSTIDDFYNSTVGSVGVITRRANNDLQSQESIKKQLNNMRESISGVNLDEETAQMISYQKSFDASARLIRTADEMLDTVLSLKRL